MLFNNGEIITNQTEAQIGLVYGNITDYESYRGAVIARIDSLVEKAIKELIKDAFNNGNEISEEDALNDISTMIERQLGIIISDKSDISEVLASIVASDRFQRFESDIKEKFNSMSLAQQSNTNENSKVSMIEAQSIYDNATIYTLIENLGSYKIPNLNF